MKIKNILFTLFIFTFMISCEKENTASNNQESTAYRKTMTVSYNNVNVDVIVDKPIQNEVDVLVVFHGTVLYDSEILNAANTRQINLCYR